LGQTGGGHDQRHRHGTDLRGRMFRPARTTVISDWIASDQKLARPMIEACAAQHAKKKGITPRDCSRQK
jgi:branched-chain amino acid transport system substrate-binding protein